MTDDGRLMTVRERDAIAEPSFRDTGEWHLPADEQGFLDWLQQHDMTLSEFQQLPAWNNAPAALKEQLAP